MKKITNTNSTIKAPIYANPELRNEAITIDNQADFDSVKDSKGVHLTGYGFKEGVEIFIEDKPCFDADPAKRQVLASWPAYKGQAKENWPWYVQCIRRQNGKNTYSWLNLNRLTDHSFVTGQSDIYVDEFRQKMDTEFNSHMERLEALRGCMISASGTTKIPAYKFNPDVRGEKLLDEDKNPIVTEQEHVTVTCDMKKLSADKAKVYKVA